MLRSTFGNVLIRGGGTVLGTHRCRIGSGVGVSPRRQDSCLQRETPIARRRPTSGTPQATSRRCQRKTMAGMTRAIMLRMLLTVTARSTGREG
jgi:hypothetical protein